MPIDRDHFMIRDHCHVNKNGDGDRFVGIKADSENAMIYFPMGYELPTQDDELRRDIKNLFQVVAAFTDKTDRVLEMDKFTAPQSVDFPIQAYRWRISDIKRTRAALVQRICKQWRCPYKRRSDRRYRHSRRHNF